MGYCKYLKANCDDKSSVIDKCANCKRRNGAVTTRRGRFGRAPQQQWYLIGLLPADKTNPAYWIDRWLWIHAENVNAAKSHWVKVMNGFVRHDEIRHIKSFGCCTCAWADLPSIETWAKEHGYLS